MLDRSEARVGPHPHTARCADRRVECERFHEASDRDTNRVREVASEWSRSSLSLRRSPSSASSGRSSGTASAARSARRSLGRGHGRRHLRLRPHVLGLRRRAPPVAHLRRQRARLAPRQGPRRSAVRRSTASRSSQYLLPFTLNYETLGPHRRGAHLRPLPRAPRRGPVMLAEPGQGEAARSCRPPTYGRPLVRKG